MKITNLDLLAGTSDHPNSVEITDILDIDTAFLVTVDYKYFGDDKGTFGVTNKKLDNSHNVLDYLSKVVEIPLLNLEPVMKQVKFQSGFVVLEGYCFAATCFNYKVKVGETIYYPKEVTIC